MIRVFESVVKQSTRSALQSVNTHFGRAVSHQEPVAKSIGQNVNKSNENDVLQKKRHCNWRAGRSLPNPFWLGTVVAAGIQLSKIATELWLKKDEYSSFGIKKPSLIRHFLTPPVRSVSFMRAGELLNRGVTNVPNENEETTLSESSNDLETMLRASDEELCCMMNRRGTEFAKCNDWEQAVKLFSSAAKEGYAPAQFNLALYHHTILKDIDSAKDYYLKATNKGHKEAAYNLSTILLDQRSPEWEAAMRKAADLGLVTAQSFLAEYYFSKGRFEFSRHYYQRLQLSGKTSKVCSYWIGRCYEEEENLLLAEMWYLRALNLPGKSLDLDATARLNRLGLTRPSRNIKESISSSILFSKNDDNQPRYSGTINPITERLKAPSFFLPSEDECFETTYSINSTYLSPGFAVSHNDSIRRSQSFIQSRS